MYRTCALLALLIVTGSCDSCESDVSRSSDEDLSASVSDDLDARLGVRFPPTKWIGGDLTPPPDMTEPCGALQQHCCAGACTDELLICAFESSSCTPDTSVCRSLSVAVFKGLYCVRNSVCTPCIDLTQVVDLSAPPVDMSAPVTCNLFGAGQRCTPGQCCYPLSCQFYEDGVRLGVCLIDPGDMAVKQPDLAGCLNDGDYCFPGTGTCCSTHCDGTFGAPVCVP